jgi:hypothetical protein
VPADGFAIREMFHRGGELEVHQGGYDFVQSHHGRHGKQVGRTERHARSFQKRSARRAAIGYGCFAAPGIIGRFTSRVLDPIGGGNMASGQGRRAHHQDPQSKADPLPVRSAHGLDIGPHNAASENPAQHAPQPDQAVEPAGRRRRHAVVQEGEEHGHHHRAVQIAE